MEFSYTCKTEIDGILEKWTGKITPLTPFDCSEYDICARGSAFHLVIGRHLNSRYIYIPTWNIAMDISFLNDRFWNREQLCYHYPELSKIDVVSIVEALAAIHDRNK